LEGLRIINFMEVNGEDVQLDNLPEVKRKEIAEAIQDKMMTSVGYRRKTA